MSAERRRSLDLAVPLGRLLAAALGLLASTWRVDGVGETRRALARASGPCLVGFWHGTYFPLFPLFRDTHVTVFVSEGFRGRLLAAIAGFFGMTAIVLPRGDRQEARARMRRALSGPVPCATAFDGPLGPPRRTKRSLVELASALRAEILPVSVSAWPAFVQPWRWDSRALPLPFARVRVTAGKPIRVPEALTSELCLDWCRVVGDAIDALSRAPRHAVCKTR